MRRNHYFKKAVQEHCFFETLRLDIYNELKTDICMLIYKVKSKVR